MNNSNARSRRAAHNRIHSKNTCSNQPDIIPSLTATFSDQGGILYVENGNLKYHGSSGTITTIAVA